MKASVIRALGPATTITLLATLVACSAQSSRRLADVPHFSFPAWQDMRVEYGDQLMLRGEEQSGNLMFQRTRSPVVYKYSPATNTLTTIEMAEWQRSTAPIAECGRQSYPSAAVLRIDGKSHRLIAGNLPTATAGPTALKLTISPDQKLVAVLSASGAVSTSILPFTGGSAASGQYFHQTFALPEARLLPTALRLYRQNEQDSLVPCWSADEHYVVYYEPAFHYLSVVAMTQSELSNPNR